MERSTSQSSDQAQFVKRILLFLAAALTCLFGAALLTPGPIQKSAYMGAEYCGSCHQEQYKTWLMSPHARAHDVLPTGDKNNLACLSCHATGVSNANEPFFKGVQCEACHGPGQYYSPMHVTKDVKLSKLVFMKETDEASCLQCHAKPVDLGLAHGAMKKIAR